MNKMRYLSYRMYLAACAGISLLFACLGVIWGMSLKRGLGLFPAALLSLFAAVLTALCLRMIVRPYQETKKIYEQFSRGYVLNDLFHMRHPLTPESEQAVLRLNEMIDKNNLISVSKKQAEYLALQNQINPHFLYNTLEGIRSEALIGGLDSVAEMTEALATFFRYTISQVEHLVTLEDELANVENYYYIQQFRFGDKLALQPIVENSIYHGIERKVGRGCLTIRIGVSDQRMRIRISDDGLGMPEEKVKQLNEKLRRLTLDDVSRDTAQKGGIAVVNVNNRLKLLFGEEYGIIFYSREGVGTDVLITLPLVLEESHEI